MCNRITAAITYCIPYYNLKIKENAGPYYSKSDYLTTKIEAFILQGAGLFCLGCMASLYKHEYDLNGRIGVMNTIAGPFFAILCLYVFNEGLKLHQTVDIIYKNRIIYTP